MTEAKWLTCEDPTELFRQHVDAMSERKARLFACGCCRSVWELLTDKRSRMALRKLEDFADDVSNSKLRRDAYNIANPAYCEMTGAADPVRAAACAVVMAAYPHPVDPRDGNVESAIMASRGCGLPEARCFKCTIFRDIFGNPFRPVAFAESWRSETVVALATGIYAERAFDRLPILADALEEAGCDHPDILAHCRGPGPHVRGCWVVDLVLGKS